MWVVGVSLPGHQKREGGGVVGLCNLLRRFTLMPSFLRSPFFFSTLDFRKDFELN